MAPLPLTPTPLPHGERGYKTRPVAVFPFSPTREKGPGDEGSPRNYAQGTAAHSSSLALPAFLAALGIPPDLPEIPRSLTLPRNDEQGRWHSFGMMSTSLAAYAALVTNTPGNPPKTDT
ncbi:MAG: hypothetical protein OHK0050_07960 [Roseiflexaceae bacterium]